jgi:ribonuclease HII
MQKATSSKIPSLRKRPDELVAGMDEVGLGPLAGPVCSAVVVFPVGYPPIEGVTDSKKVSAKKRLKLAPLILEQATFVGVGWSAPSVVDAFGVSEAWRRAGIDALEGMPKISVLRIDGTRELKGFSGKQECIIQGDAKVWYIGAASIIAKVARDTEMAYLSDFHPSFGWAKNKGYGSKQHLEALAKFGPTRHHRGLYLRKIYEKIKSRVPEGTKSWDEWLSKWAHLDENEDYLEFI